MPRPKVTAGREGIQLRNSANSTGGSSAFGSAIKNVLMGFAILVVGIQVGQSWNGAGLIVPATDTKKSANARSTTSIRKNRKEKVIEDCNFLERQMIQRELPSGGHVAWRSRCPISDAWLSGYLDNYPEEDDKFIFLNFGCNKGYDAVRVAADVSRRRDVFDKDNWKSHLGIDSPGACGQETDRHAPVDPSLPKRPVEVHCVEAVPNTAKSLTHAAKMTTAAQHGLQIHNMALTGKGGPSSIAFPNAGAGVEGTGLGTCTGDGKPALKKLCTDVPAVTMDQFVSTHVDKGNAADTSDRIQFITIDIEGYDFTAMKGGPQTLQRTDYLEFEFHKEGDWANQNIKDATDMLEGYGMACYWSGKNMLWRITGCWVNVYGSFHDWSNVACVNPIHQPELAQKMEDVFQATMEQTLNRTLAKIK